MVNKSFEEKIENLEQIVTDLENGKMGIEDSINQFEVGVSLYKECKSQLKQVEKKISILKDSLKEEEYLG